MAEVQKEPGVPEWTEQDKRNGLDPLGMQATSIALYQSFVPGISNVTLRTRYYGLHTWLATRYAQDHHAPSEDEWIRFLRRAEALYALVTAYNTGDVGVAGTDWAKVAIAEAKGAPIVFHPHTDRGAEKQYLLQKSGVFGAAYSSQLIAVGLLQEAASHKLLIPTKEGSALASAFASAAADLGRDFLQIAAGGEVSAGDLKRLAPLVPSRIGTETAERQAYEDVLFAPAAAKDSRAARRRATLRLILQAARELGREPNPSDIAWGSYAGHNALGQPIAAALTDEDAQQRYRWAVYQANELNHLAHETLLRFALEALAPHSAGVTMQALLSDVVEALLAVSAEPPETWAGLEASIDLPANAWSAGDAAEYQLTRVTLRAPLEGAIGAEVAWDAVLLLAVLNLRLRSQRDRIWEVLEPASHRTSQTVLTETEWLHRRRDQPLAQTLAAFIKTRVLDRHLNVAFAKMMRDDYTFLFEVDEGRVRYRRKAGAVATTPRLGPAITFLRDIHLIDAGGITPQGNRVLEKS